MRPQPANDITRPFGARRRTAWLLLLAATACGGCRATVPIRDLLDDPYAYDRRKVKIEGSVEAAAAAFGHGAYLVDDGTGALLVVAERHEGVPRAGARVAVVGWFRSLFDFGSVSAAVMIERDRALRHRSSGVDRD